MHLPRVALPRVLRPYVALLRVTAALLAGGLILVLAVHTATATRVTTAGGPSLGITVRSGNAGSSCSVHAGTSSADCPGVDLFAGARLSPGSSHTTVVVARNDGRLALRDLALMPGLCTSPAASGQARTLCSDIRLRVTTVRADGRVAIPVADEPLATLGRTPVRLAPLPAPGQQETVRLTVTLDRTTSPALLGRSVALPLSWHAGV